MAKEQNTVVWLKLDEFDLVYVEHWAKKVEIGLEEAAVAIVDYACRSLMNLSDREAFLQIRIGPWPVIHERVGRRRSVDVCLRLYPVLVNYLKGPGWKRAVGCEVPAFGPPTLKLVIRRYLSFGMHQLCEEPADKVPGLLRAA